MEGLLAPDVWGAKHSPVVHLHEVIQSCVRLVRHQLDQKYQELELRLFNDDDCLNIDREQLARVIDNLLGNAIKFTPDHGHICMTSQQMSGGVQLLIKDSGIGIPEAIQAKLFTLSNEKQRSGTSGEISHGLGLPICKRIIEGAGGTITYQSKPTKGTVFYVWLPSFQTLMV